MRMKNPSAPPTFSWKWIMQLMLCWKWWQTLIWIQNNLAYSSPFYIINSNIYAANLLISSLDYRSNENNSAPFTYLW